MFEDLQNYRTTELQNQRTTELEEISQCIWYCTVIDGFKQPWSKLIVHVEKSPNNFLRYIKTSNPPHNVS